MKSHRQAALPAFDQVVAVRRGLEAMTEQIQSGHMDFQDIPGCESAKRALEIAAAGGHVCQLVPSVEPSVDHRAGTSAVAAQALLLAFSTGFNDLPLPLIVDQPDKNKMYCAVSLSEIDLVLPPPAEPTSAIAARVLKARHQIEPSRAVDHDGKRLLDEAARRCPLETATVALAITVGNSLAALAGETVIRRLQIAEAICYLYRG